MIINTRYFVVMEITAVIHHPASFNGTDCLSPTFLTWRAGFAHMCCGDHLGCPYHLIRLDNTDSVSQFPLL